MDADGPHELCCWTDPPHVPKCLESCLRIISLLKFISLEHDLEFVQFFLKNAGVLEKMGILTGLLDLAENSRILKKFSELPRGSSKCELFLLNGIFSLSLMNVIMTCVSMLLLICWDYSVSVTFVLTT